MSKSHADIIGLWLSTADFAAAIGVDYNQAKLMRRRNSIPVEYWPEVVADAQRRGFAGISYETLVVAVVARRRAIRRARVNGATEERSSVASSA